MYNSEIQHYTISAIHSGSNIHVSFIFPKTDILPHGYKFTCNEHTSFGHYSFRWMSSIQALQVLTVLQVPIQATQHKDDTLP